MLKMFSKKFLYLVTALTLSSCSYPPFQKQKDYKTEKLIQLLELAVKENLAKVDSTLNTRKITLDLNPLDNKDPEQKGTYEKDHPSLYNIFGVDEIIYVDKGKYRYSKEDTLITKVSLKNTKEKTLAHFTLKDTQTYKNGIPTMNSKGEIMYEKYAIKRKDTKKWVSPQEEYYRFMNQVEKLVKNKLKETKPNPN